MNTFYRRFVRMRSAHGGRGLIFLTALSLVSLLVLLEWYFNFDFSLGILYIFPVMLAATIFDRWQIVLAAALCAYTRGLFTADETHLEHVLRFCMATIAYTACGLWIYQIADSRRVVLKHYSRLRYEQRMRRRVQEQLRLLAQSSPAAILTMDCDGKIVAANQAAEILLQSDRPLLGQDIRRYVGLFHDALQLPARMGEIRTSSTAWARRADGTVLPVTTWFSIYGEGPARHLAAIVVDTSDEVREREQAQFEQIVHHDRILAGAVSHEIRNLCSAIFVVASNMERSSIISGNPDFIALKNLASGLRDLASLDPHKETRMRVSSVRLQELAEEMRVIVGQDWSDIDGEFEWLVPPNLPAVRANHHGLIQILLNLSQNALRAVQRSAERQLKIETVFAEEKVFLRVCDTGPGISKVEDLFQPFRPESDGSGLGLYVSRAMVESFGGELHFEPTESGCCFVIVLLPADLKAASI
ncbi:sensor histidine kinase [Edaphobacter sp. 12200R-103]|uniref:sensor histidine kinase n=1 Tax=Edaphobacter sp. 12200R-103 TaxID=2703788 RepID=UPI00138DA7B8|nr:PAS domain-containing sensor histidine kinase [Edaphobacter sp. 12200R-103]QHS53421.1 PAS domain S-box protein [Edaphobacter sp. 12200R-103]